MLAHHPKPSSLWARVLKARSILVGREDEPDHLIWPWTKSALCTVKSSYVKFLPMISRSLIANNSHYVPDKFETSTISESTIEESEKMIVAKKIEHVLLASRRLVAKLLGYLVYTFIMRLVLTSG